MVENPKSRRPTQGCQDTDDDDYDDDRDDIRHNRFFNFQCPAVFVKLQVICP